MKIKYTLFVVLVLVSTCVAAAEPGRRPVQYNLDCSEFFVGTFGPVRPATIDKFVDEHAAAGVTELFINVNAQRTNYRSNVWESEWDGYNPQLGDDQPFFAGIDPKRRFETALTKNVLAIHKMGCDYPRRMIRRARFRKLKAWISLRMNDAHNPSRPKHPSHSKFWRSQIRWHLSNGALDYERPEVREHYMKLVREVCQRYDIDGLELDFQRFWLYFRPKREHVGRQLMHKFVAEARQATRQAAQRLGHSVRLAVRVPSSPWIARRYGLDAIAWAKAGLVDQITASHFWVSTNSDIPIELWKGLLIGTNVKVAVGIEDGVTSGATKRRTLTPEEMRGLFASGLHRGADAAYCFNLFTGPYQRWPRAEHNRLLRDAGSLPALAKSPRRHCITRTYPWAAGAPSPTRVLPSSGKAGQFRLHIGPKPTAAQQAQVELIVVGGKSKRVEVAVNDHPCKFVGIKTPTHIRTSGWKWEGNDPRHIYSIPQAALASGYNLVSCTSKDNVQLHWVEISIR